MERAWLSAAPNRGVRGGGTAPVASSRLVSHLPCVPLTYRLTKQAYQQQRRLPAALAKALCLLPSYRQAHISLPASLVSGQARASPVLPLPFAPLRRYADPLPVSAADQPMARYLPLPASPPNSTIFQPASWRFVCATRARRRISRQMRAYARVPLAFAGGRGGGRGEHPTCCIVGAGRYRQHAA